jgi:hypothetical protein
MSATTTPSRLMQNLALANAAGDLRGALEALLPLAARERDRILCQMVIGDEITIGQRIANHAIVRNASIWNDAIVAAEKAIAKSKGGRVMAKNRTLIPDFATAGQSMELSGCFTATRDRELLDALKETADIVEENINTIVESNCNQDSEGGYVLSTMSKLARHDFNRYTKALLAARKAIKKAGGE